MRARIVGHLHRDPHAPANTGAFAFHHHPHTFSRYHLVITYFVPLRTFIPW